jgi:RNA polymerase sigma-70 factor (ECF subfamily)
MALSTGARLDMATTPDARSRLLGELAGAPARKGYGIAYDLLGNRAEAEEAVQEALVRACESIGDLRDPAAAPAWYLRIVTTQCLRVLRRRRLRRALLGWLPGAGSDEQSADAEAGTSARLHVAPGSSSTEAIASRVHATDTELVREPDVALVDRERLGALLGRLDELSPQQRAALVLRYGHDVPVAEIAEMLGVGLATAKTHLVRGLARLRDLMEEHQ